MFLEYNISVAMLRKFIIVPDSRFPTIREASRSGAFLLFKQGGLFNEKTAILVDGESPLKKPYNINDKIHISKMSTSD